MNSVPFTSADLDAVRALRGLALDAPRAANSGHTGTAMALAPLAHVLFTRHLRHDPADPTWPDRDRFVLSCGHASILLYSLLHLSGYGVTQSDLRDFRQWGSRTPGHPEFGHTAGVEFTTGPLGQGFATAVGMAMAEANLRSRFGDDTCQHRTIVFAGDGDLHEGISHEAASLAGHLRLEHLTVFFDDNGITIDGSTALSCSDDVAARFRSYGWRVVEAGPISNDLEALDELLTRVTTPEGQPTLVILPTVIGAPAPTRQGTKEAHGEPFPVDEIRATKELLGIPADESFWIPDAAYEPYEAARTRGAAASRAWNDRVATAPGSDEFAMAFAAVLATDWEKDLPVWTEGSVATRAASQACLAAMAPHFPALIVGAADLTGNTGVAVSDFTSMQAENIGGRAVHFGIREHAMAAAMNGMAVHGGAFPVGGTFLVFSDYMRPAVRLAALTQARVVYSWSHDSVGLGEDGPTHQPVEHLASLRAIPGLRVIRPADANECVHAWRVAMQSEGPVAMILSRQALPVLPHTADAADGVARGGYVLSEAPRPDAIDITLIGTGSEVAPCLDAQRILAEQGISARVVSLPCWDLLQEQDEVYGSELLPTAAPVLAVEAGSSMGWERFADDVVAIDHFGFSAPGNEILARLGFTGENIAARAQLLLDSYGGVDLVAAEQYYATLDDTDPEEEGPQ